MNYHIDSLGPVINPLNNTSTQVPSSSLEVKGWAIDEPFQSVAGNVDVMIVPYAARYGLPRQDVAAFFKNPAFEKSGFEFSIPKTALTPGSHKFALRPVGNDGKSYDESPVLTLVVQ